MNKPAENQYANSSANTLKHAPIGHPFRTPKLILPDRGLKPSAITCFPSREMLLAEFNPKRRRAVHGDYAELGGAWQSRILKFFIFRQPNIW